MNKIAIIGTGGFARHIKELVDLNDNFAFCGFIGKKDDVNANYYDCDIEKLRSDDVRHLVNGIGNLSENNKKIIELVNYYINKKFNFPIIIHPSACVSPSASIGNGTLILENAVIKSHSNIGEFCIINTLSIVSHDCSLGNFNHLSLGAKMGGNVKINNNNFFGINSSVIQNVSIGSNVIVGAGSVVINDFGSDLKIVGNPAKEMLVKKK